MSLTPARKSWIAQGAMVPGVLTGVAFAAGLIFSIRDEAGLSPPQHLLNAWIWVRYGLLLSFLGGTSLVALLHGVGSESGRWRFLGGGAAFVLLLGAIWLTRDLDFQQPEEEAREQPPGIVLELNWRRGD